MKPCPLCGSTDIACFAEECGDSYDNVPTFRAVVGCRGCHEEGCDPSYDDEPCFGIEVYFRADHPLVRDCEDPWDIERVLEHHMAERWNRRAERTCQFFYDEKSGEYMCSACGEQVSGSNPDDEYEVSAKAVLEWFNFCPHCGARVIKEDS